MDINNNKRKKECHIDRLHTKDYCIVKFFYIAVTLKIANLEKAIIVCRQSRIQSDDD